jgi:hypothetical protein
VLSTHPRVDVHQHLWPPAFLDALRVRSTPPYVRDWTLHLDGEPPYEVNPAHHDVDGRADREHSDDLLVSLSSPLGIEHLSPDEGAPLLDAWHVGAAALPSPFKAWASVNGHEPNLEDLARHLTSGFIGLQIPATLLSTPAPLERLLPVLRVAEAAGKPVLVHPGPVVAADEELPSWWPAVVSYPAQLQAAWWAWAAAGRRSLPQLRICFAAGAGLGPVHHERFTARGGGNIRIDKCTYVDTSSYGPRGLDSLIRVLGIDAIVFGSDRPYAGHAAPHYFGEAAQRAVHVTNPRRLLEG